VVELPDADVCQLGELPDGVGALGRDHEGTVEPDVT
jgi:hypothetical protein